MNGPRFLIEGIVFIVAYAALDWASFIYEFSPLGFTPWNPQSGLSLAFLLRRPLVNALWLPPAALLADLLVRGWPASPELAALSALVLSAGYAGAAHLLRHLVVFDLRLSGVRDTVALFALGTMASLVVAILYAGLYATAGLIPWLDFPAAASRHWVGDIIGIVVVTPLLLRFPRPADARPARFDWAEIAVQAASVPAVLWIVFLPQTDEFKFFYLLFLPVIWAAVRHGMDGAVIALAATQLGLVAAVQIRSFAPNTVIELQILLLALAFTGLLIGAIVSERQRSQAALHDSEVRLREHQAELAQFSRVSVVGEMASTLAHELSQPLSATATYLSACNRLLKAPRVELDVIREAIAKAEIQAQRAGQVLAGLRDFLWRGESRLVPVAASALIASVAGLARGEVERIGAAMTLIDEAKGAIILADRIQVEQALLNLVRNATEALSEQPGSGARHLTIEARGEPASVTIAVSDSGPGIAAEIADRLFQPFVSTKARGMGLGLTITRSIVEAHGGRLLFTARPGGGAVFRMIFPRTSES